MSENTSNTLIISCVLICITALVGHGCYQYEQTSRDAIKAGLIQKQGVGVREWFWDKPAPTPQNK